MTPETYDKLLILADPGLLAELREIGLGHRGRGRPASGIDGEAAGGIRAATPAPGPQRGKDEAG